MVLRVEQISSSPSHLFISFINKHIIIMNFYINALSQIIILFTKIIIIQQYGHTKSTIL